MAESIDFQIPMKAACTREIGSFCTNVPHGHARVIRSACAQSRRHVTTSFHQMPLPNMSPQVGDYAKLSLPEGKGVL